MKKLKALAGGLACAALSSSLLAAPVQAPPPGGDDLASVIRLALDSQPELQARWHAFLAAQDARRQAFGEHLPTLDLNASLGRGDREYDARGDFSRHYAELSLTQVLFDGFRIRSRVARADHEQRARYYELLGEAETKVLEASEAYLDVLRYREMVVLARKNYQSHRRVFGQIEQRAQRGVGNRADLSQISGRLSLAESNLMTEIANLHNVSARFERIVGRAPADQMQPAGLADGAVPSGIADVLNAGYGHNPVLLAAFENIGAAKASLAEHKAHRYPRLELGVRHGYYENNNAFDDRTDPDSYGNETIVELRGRYNLFQGGSGVAGERAAQHRVEQSEDLRDKACIDLRQTASIARNDIANLDRKLASLRAHRDQAGSVITAYREQFDIGRRSLLDVLDSENEFFQAERALSHGQYDRSIAQFRTLHAMGGLLATLSSTPENLQALAVDREELAEQVRAHCARFQAQDWDLDALMDFERAQAATPAPAAAVAEPELIELSGDALFATASAELRAGATTGLDALVVRLRDPAGKVEKIVITGHTDSTGSEAGNRDLSLRRAAAVRDYLLANGVTRGVIAINGVAADHPVATNATPEGRAANRRVEVRVVRSQ